MRRRRAVARSSRPRPATGAARSPADRSRAELGELPVRDRALVTVVARSSGIGVVTSTARASANEPDGSQGNNVAVLTMEALPCTLVAREYGDRLVGTAGADEICGRSGPDLIFALAGNDTIDAGLGPDRVYPGPGRDVVRLRAGADSPTPGTGSATRSTAAASATSSSSTPSTPSVTATTWRALRFTAARRSGR